MSSAPPEAHAHFGHFVKECGSPLLRRDCNGLCCTKAEMEVDRGVLIVLERQAHPLVGCLCLVHQPLALFLCFSLVYPRALLCLLLLRWHFGGMSTTNEIESHIISQADQVADLPTDLDFKTFASLWKGCLLGRPRIYLPGPRALTLPKTLAQSSENPPAMSADKGALTRKRTFPAAIAVALHHALVPQADATGGHDDDGNEVIPRTPDVPATQPDDDYESHRADAARRVARRLFEDDPATTDEEVARATANRVRNVFHALRTAIRTAIRAQEKAPSADPRPSTPPPSSGSPIQRPRRPPPVEIPATPNPPQHAIADRVAPGAPIRIRCRIRPAGPRDYPPIAMHPLAPHTSPERPPRRVTPPDAPARPPRPDGGPISYEPESIKLGLDRAHFDEQRLPASEPHECTTFLPRRVVHRAHGFRVRLRPGNEESAWVRLDGCRMLDTDVRLHLNFATNEFFFVMGVFRGTGTFYGPCAWGFVTNPESVELTLTRESEIQMTARWPDGDGDTQLLELYTRSVRVLHFTSQIACRYGSLYCHATRSINLIRGRVALFDASCFPRDAARVAVDLFTGHGITLQAPFGLRIRFSVIVTAPSDERICIGRDGINSSGYSIVGA